MRVWMGLTDNWEMAKILTDNWHLDSPIQTLEYELHWLARRKSS